MTRNHGRRAVEATKELNFTNEREREADREARDGKLHIHPIRSCRRGVHSRKKMEKEYKNRAVRELSKVGRLNLD